MIERQTDIPTKSGAMSTFICHPERNGPHPTVIFYMDAPGIRDELRDMASRIATVGYYVMLPNLYYRENVGELGSFIGPGNEATRDKMMQLMATLTIAKVMDDTDALIAFASSDQAASNGPISCVGYCMSGQFAISAAARHPDRIAAAASIYGVRLVTGGPDSPHLAARHANAEIYVACAEKDEHAPVAEAEQFGQSLRGAGINVEVEVYPNVDHGFAFPERPIFNKPAAERHWERLFALFARPQR